MWDNLEKSWDLILYIIQEWWLLTMNVWNACTPAVRITLAGILLAPVFISIIKLIVKYFTYNTCRACGDSSRVSRKKAKQAADITDLAFSVNDISNSLKK